MDSDRLKKEQIFHDSRFGGDDSARKDAQKYYEVLKGMQNCFDRIVESLCKDKKLLEYGCGTGSGSEQWLNYGAFLTGIDISPEGINKAKESFPLKENKTEYFVMDAENMEFDDGSFDVVVGSGIIHHLNIVKCYSELSRVLKDDGHAVFTEPLGHNPLINWYRNKTPEMRTEDEHPLMINDLKLLKKYFNQVDIKFYSLLTLAAVPFRNIFLFAPIYSILSVLDRILLSIPGINKLAWMVVIHVSYPKE